MPYPGHPRGPLATQKYTSYLRRYGRSAGIGLGTLKYVEELTWNDRNGKSGHFCAEKDTPGIDTTIEPVVKIKIKWDTTQEYIVQNNDNYSWKITQKPPETFSPAIVNTPYCNNGGIWNIDGQNISFNNSSSYSKEDIPSKKIVWDINKEHILNNPDNYSYSIIPSETIRVDFGWGYPLPGYKGTAKLTLTGNDEYEYMEINNPDANGRVFSSSRIDVPVFKLWGYTEFNIIYGGGKIFNFWYASFGGYAAYMELNQIDPDQKFTLKITDGNTNYSYPLIDKNSVNVVDDNSNTKFKFNINSEILEIIADKNSTVSVSCNVLYNNLEITDGGILNKYDILDTNSVIEKQNNLYKYTITDTVKTENHEIAVSNPTEIKDIKGYEWVHKKYTIKSSGNPCNPSGFNCTCPDFTQQDETRNWSGSNAGPFNPCKHIMAAKRLLNIEQSYGGYP